MDDKAEKLCQDDHKVDYPCGSYIKSTKRKGTVGDLMSMRSLFFGR